MKKPKQNLLYADVYKLMKKKNTVIKYKIISFENIVLNKTKDLNFPSQKIELTK